MSLPVLFTRASASGDCTKDTCPASASIYGYAPDWDFNLFFAIGFGITALVFSHESLIWPKWRAYSLACAIGCLMESGGYVGRLLLSKDPFSDIGFKLNVVLLTIAPAFISAGIYITLKHAVIIFGRHLSHLPPNAYMYIFVACDVVSIILQGVGGSISAIAEEKSVLDQGVNVMIAGLASQVFTLMVFFGLVIEYFIRCRRQTERLNLGTINLAKSAKFRLFVAAVTIAFLAIFARCCYRVAELCNGWGSEIMREEREFIILDSDMCTLASITLSVFHPGLFLKVKERVQILPESEYTEMKEAQTKGRPCQMCGRPAGNWL
ncbi:RTA1-domain-containing protein [Hortaea werneckii]|nr:RTA1-domain-containing protein [Hortaea werneckii]KAI7310672.1 RTA1-domain-containing protein [Hortaea werneckii]